MTWFPSMCAYCGATGSVHLITCPKSKDAVDVLIALWQHLEGGCVMARETLRDETLDRETKLKHVEEFIEASHHTLSQIEAELKKIK